MINDSRFQYILSRSLTKCIIKTHGENYSKKDSPFHRTTYSGFIRQAFYLIEVAAKRSHVEKGYNDNIKYRATVIDLSVAYDTV